MPHLNTVVVSDNGIKLLHPEVFWGLLDLRHLDVHNNTIDHIHPNTFRNNPRLSKLDLSCNRLKHLHQVFRYTEELKFLNLSSNNFTYEDLAFFLPITTLQILDLSNNEIDTVREEIFEGMVHLKHLNISGNPRLEYDCRLRALWTLCSERNISCVTGDEQSFRMVVNLHCGTEEQLKDLSLTDESDGFIKTSEYSTEGGVQEGSGSEPDEGRTDVEMKEVSSTETVVNQSTDTSDSDGALIWIIVGSVCCGVILVIGVVFLIRRCRHPREETAGNLSPTNSFCYLNAGTFASSNRSPRSGNKSSYSQCECTNLTGSNRSISRYQDASYVVAEIVRVPSIKTRVAAPLNLPEEISVQERDLII
jgi:hypothetical protein